MKLKQSFIKVSSKKHCVLENAFCLGEEEMSVRNKEKGYIKPTVTRGNIRPLLVFPVVPCERTDTYCTQKRQPMGTTLHKRSIHKCQKRLRQLASYFWNSTPWRVESVVNREATLKSIPQARLNCFLKPGIRDSGNVPLARTQQGGSKICPSTVLN